jgi:hypothetical protein
MAGSSEHHRFETYPDLTRFYGLTPEQIAEMPRPLRLVYERAMKRIVATEQARMLDVITFPHQKQQARQKFARQLERKINGGRTSNQQVPTSGKEMKQTAAGIGIKVMTSSERKAREEKRKKAADG